MALEWGISISCEWDLPISPFVVMDFSLFQLIQLRRLLLVLLLKIWLNIKIDRLADWLSEWVQTNLSRNLHTENCVRRAYACECVYVYAHANRKAMRTQSIVARLPVIFHARSMKKNLFFWHRNNVLSKSIYNGSMNTLIKLKECFIDTFVAHCGF